MQHVPVSGAQFTLRAGHYIAEVADVGASLRSLRHRGRDLIVPFDADELRPAMRGAILAPWPNRTADGRYRFGGVEHQLPINEPETANASHGLVAWQRFTAADHATDGVRLRTTIEPQPGYPWRVDLCVRYRLTPAGLEITLVATNESHTDAPFGAGIHPYLLGGPAGPGAVAEWSLSLPATRLLLTDARMLPAGLVAVDEHQDGAFDFRTHRRIASTVLNNAFTGLIRDEHGRTRVRVTDQHGTGVEVEWDERSPWVQIYTTDEADAEEHRHAVAVEPQTCPPDALNSGQDLLSIAPHESIELAWQIRAVD